MITVIFTPQEIQALATLIDMAVKAGGMRVAEAALVLTKKLADAQQVQQPTKKEKKEKKEDPAP